MSFPLFLTGITGSMGCGKSTVGALLERQGARKLDSDRLAREVLAPGSSGLQAVLDRFGRDLLDQAGVLNRRLLGQRAFASQEGWQDLEAIIHPRVVARQRQLLAQWAEHPQPEGAPLMVVMEIPLLFETGAQVRLDTVVAVVCGQKRQQAWLADRPGRMTPELQRKLLARQWTETEKARRADHVVDNTGSREELDLSAVRLWNTLLNQARQTVNPAWPTRWPTS